VQLIFENEIYTSRFAEAKKPSAYFAVPVSAPSRPSRHTRAWPQSPRTAGVMFFLYTLERRVTLHPSYFGKNMHELVTGKLLSDVEGTCTGSYYIITIMDTFDISEGRILPGSGLAEFTVRYKAVVWRPFKGETV
jgi:hypothetical protein